MKKKEVYKKVLLLAKAIARKKEGALFIIGPEKKFKGTYESLYPQVGTLKISEKGSEKVIEKLATLDGAVLISDTGEVIGYGARIKKSKPVTGFGTKHAAAAGITAYIKNATAIVVSEEVNWIRVFRNGSIILEMDASKLPKHVENKVVSYISSGDKAVAAGIAAGAGLTAAALGAPIIAPIILIGGTYLAIKTATGMIKRRLSTEGRRARRQSRKRRH